MVNNKKMVDPRSTGRRRARKTLFDSYADYKCVGYQKGNKTVECGKTSVNPPKDAPSHFSEIWPEENRVITTSLQADHESKDMYNNDEDEINWRCPSCHKYQDLQTSKGEATVEVDNKLW
jgi:hypothetical protein